MDKTDEKKELGEVKEHELAGVPPVNINNLVVGHIERQDVILGNTSSFLSYIGKAKVREILWNEEYFVARTSEKHGLIAYKPELEPTTGMFFLREKKGRRDDEGNEMQVWEGEYTPIEFSKANLIKFLKAHVNQVPQETIDSIKNLRVVEKKIQSEEMIALNDGTFDDENVRTVEEATAIANIPSKFVLHLPLFDGYAADFQFEAKVAKPREERYGDPNKGKKVIQLRVLNAREVLRGIMLDLLTKIPENIPRYYGKLHIAGKKSEY